MTDTPVPRSPDADAPITEQDRQVLVRHIQSAMLQEQIGFEEIDDRFAAVYQAQTRAELDRVVHDLPSPAAPVPPGHPVPRQSLALLGDVKVGGWIETGSEITYGTILGDVVIDLSSATLPDQVTITVWNFAGDTTVILPDGVRATLEGFLALGDRKIDLTGPRHGAPMVTVRSYKVLGDARLFSLSRVPEGRIRKLWRKLRQED
ncbi:MAG: DUF1707 domain-containing protein [Actinomycetota bacterium]